MFSSDGLFGVLYIVFGTMQVVVYYCMPIFAIATLSVRQELRNQIKARRLAAAQLADGLLVIISLVAMQIVLGSFWVSEQKNSKPMKSREMGRRRRRGKK